MRRTPSIALSAAFVVTLGLTLTAQPAAGGHGHDGHGGHHHSDDTVRFAHTWHAPSFVGDRLN